MSNRQPQPDRRRALKALGLGTGVLLSSGAAQSASPSQEAAPTTKPSGYRETPHVLTYYATLRS